MASIALPRSEARAPSGVMAWLTTVDHKKIGILYLYTTFFFFLVGGIMAGAAAVFYILRIGITRYDAGFILGVKAFTAAVLGGIGNLRGALIGGFVLGLAENYGSALIGTQWKDVVAFLLLVVILMFRPTGLLGESLGRSRA